MFGVARRPFSSARGGGQVGLSDLTRGSVLPKELDGLLAWIACIADAQPVSVIAFSISAQLGLPRGSDGTAR
jgi:hypothetical protein